MGFVNISDGSITPTPPPPHEGSDELGRYAADEQFANVFWEWADGAWHQHKAPAGTIYNPLIEPGPVCDLPRNYASGAPYVLDDPSLEGA